MQKKAQQVLAIIQKARVNSYQGRYQQARQMFVAAITQMKQLQNIEKDQKKKNLIKKQLQMYFKQAKQNKMKLDKKTEVYKKQLQNVKSLQKINYQQKIIKQSPFSQQFKPITINQNTKNQQILKLQPTTLKIRNIDPEIQTFILPVNQVNFNKIIGLESTKKMLMQAIILPKKRPDIFCGIRAPPRGILFYGPPGNGKTFLAKAIASQSGCVFFSLSASSILNKYVGDSQKMLKNIFKTAYDCAPSIIFIDEIDSILTSRKQEQNQASRRVKTQFLVQLQGSTTTDNDKLVVIGATNLPNQLDKAALRRFTKKIYIGMPQKQARKAIIKQIISNVSYKISQKQFDDVSKMLQNYSASQITFISKEAASVPLRQKSNILHLDAKNIRPVTKADFLYVIKHTPPNLTSQQIEKYKKFGQ